LSARPNYPIDVKSHGMKTMLTHLPEFESRMLADSRSGLSGRERILLLSPGSSNRIFRGNFYSVTGANDRKMGGDCRHRCGAGLAFLNHILPAISKRVRLWITCSCRECQRVCDGIVKSGPASTVGG